MTGTLYGLGIGPGDPDLITLKAKDILARVPVIAYPAPEGGESLVRALAAPHIPAGAIEVVIETPMVAERFPAQDAYSRVCLTLAQHLDAGRDVAVLCEGDPFLYGSFMYVFERLAGTYPAQVVPGVSSLTAVAARAGVPIAERNETLVVLPATLPTAELEARLARAEAAVIMKVGRHVAKVRSIVQGLGLMAGAWYVERATMANERVLPLAAVDADAAPYFSTILVRRPADKARIAPEPPADVALVCLSAAAQALAMRLKPHLPGASVHGLSGRTSDADVSFRDTTAHLQALFRDGVPIAGVCAAGILIRALAPLLDDKHAEPPVVAVAEDGSVVVPLLGGHHGANRLARAIAAATAGVPAITTAGDVRFGVALDDPPPGWRVPDAAAVKPVTAALLAGEPVALTCEAGDAGWLTAAGISFAESADHAIRITDRRVEPAPTTLALHPPVLAVGVGCERDAAPDETLALVRATLDEHGLAEGAVACVVSVNVKADEPAVHAVAEALGVPARFFTADQLEQETPRLATPSETVFRAVGCHGVAEAAALAASGPAAHLIVAKTVGGRATCAVARAPQAIVAAEVGRPQGQLTIVGIGPGQAGWRTAEAVQALTAATDIVGYRLYLDLVADLIAGKEQHSAPMTEEAARARTALDLAAEGRRVALISSGDAGIYGLASLVFELLDLEDRPEWNRIALSVAPGITALQAAAARAGALIGHDFCAISLSTLLTPWTRIEARVRAAAEADFVVAFYNPVSQRRRSEIERARDILLAHRPPTTPVLLARNLGRAGETEVIIPLADLTADHADMLTLVMVGSSQTKGAVRGRRQWLYTPRGYAAKLAPASARAGEPA
ncbi:MAG: precorrin-3B C(17)-methyltransferase [Defluviicoccus sp.]|nr:precorrin-3B C(17)-methyltransferase [Defluviicoccus sp.]